MTTCGRCGAPTPPGARFCPACGAAAAEAPVASQALKTVTVAFTDMVDSTVLGEKLDPESLHTVMREYFDTIRGVVERYGGSVEKFIGDAVVAVFGIPALHEDDPVRAVSAASAIHRAIGDLAARLRRDAGLALEIRTGVNTGEVLSKEETGGSGRLVGDAVNVAARLQQAAPPGEILVAPSTYELVKERVRTAELGPLSVKGRSAPGAAYRLLEVLPTPSTTPKHHGPIVGRDHEVRLLRDTLRRVDEGRSPHLVTVLGAPGVGKSRLVAELGKDGEAVVLQGRCLPYGEGITYWPVAEIVQRAAAIESDDPPDVARRKLVASAGDDDEAAAIAERVAQLVGLSESEGTTDDLFWAVRRYFENVAARQPLVVVFDDLHWAEATMLDLVEHVVASVADVPLLVVCLARPELLDHRPSWGAGKINASTFELGPLSEADCRVLVESLLGESPSVEEVTGAVFRVADGNPLFVEEMVSMLVDEGLLARAEGYWKATRPLASLHVPPTVQALVSARLDRLTREEREVVGVAAVMGQVFAPQAVSELASIGANVDEALGGLTRKQLLAPTDTEFAGGRTYAFRHLLIRDTAYEHLPRMTRAAIHERYAEWLVGVLGDRSAEYDEIVGYHLEQAHHYQSRLGGFTAERSDLAPRAAERLAEGGRRALARQDAAAAVKLLSRAADLLAGEDAKRLSLLPDLGRAFFESGSYARAMEAFEEAIDLGTKLEDMRTATTCRIFNERVRIHRDPQVNTEELRPVAEQAIRTLEVLEDEYGLCYGWDLLAYVHDCAGRSAEALEALREAATHAERSAVPSLVRYQKRTLLSSLSWGAGEVSEIVPLAEELLDSARKTGDRYSEVRALLTLAQARAMRGQFSEARELIASQKKVCAEVGLEFIHAYGAFERAQVEVLAGDLDAAEAEARAGCEILTRMDEKAVLPTLQVQLADLLYRRGEIEEAERLVDEARALSAPDDSLTEMKWRAVAAKITASRGTEQEAISLALDAVAIANPTGYLDWHAGVLTDVATVMELTGRREEALRSLEQAAELYRRKGNRVAQGSIEQRLHELRPV